MERLTVQLVAAPKKKEKELDKFFRLLEEHADEYGEDFLRNLYIKLGATPDLWDGWQQGYEGYDKMHRIVRKLFGKRMFNHLDEMSQDDARPWLSEAVAFVVGDLSLSQLRRASGGIKAPYSSEDLAELAEIRKNLDKVKTKIPENMNESKFKDILKTKYGMKLRRQRGDTYLSDSFTKAMANFFIKQGFKSQFKEGPFAKFNNEDGYYFETTGGSPFAVLFNAKKNAWYIPESFGY